MCVGIYLQPFLINIVNKHTQSGFIEVAIFATILFFAIATVAVRHFNEHRKLQANISQSNSIRIVRDALQKYADVNKASFRQSKEIMYVNNQYAPDLKELKDLGFLTVSGYDMALQFGSGIATKVTLTNPPVIDGFVYLTSGVKDKDGQPDPQRACAIARALADIGICSSKSTPNILGNSKVQKPNPTGLPAIVGALIYVK